MASYWYRVSIDQAICKEENKMLNKDTFVPMQFFKKKRLTPGA